ncbi:hypothetical protein LJC25_02530, partial [Bacteroidales bacterium OttesenSCG-928-K03]|nr:hypothetical protein [Bacteroidales bacterium OttesenSCG-928-K03]
YTGTAVYVELDFKVDTVMIVGLEAVYESSRIVQYPVIALNPKQDWTKIYISLTTEIGYFYDADYYNIYFSGGFIPSSSDDTIERKEFFIDNIKLVY